MENAFRDHPDVLECGVIGVPDARWGEVGRAIIVLRPGTPVTETDLLEWLDGRIARYKIPKSVRFTSELPRSGAGKILRKQLRDRYAAGPLQRRRRALMTTVINGLDELKSLAAAGTDLGHTDWMEITEDRINRFADATDDHQWIHVDAERAAAGPFGTTIAHGYLTLSLVIPQLGGLISVTGVSMGINYGLNRVRFPSPVPVGSRIRLSGKLASAEDVGGGAVQVTMDLATEIEGGAKPACVAQALYRYYP